MNQLRKRDLLRPGRARRARLQHGAGEVVLHELLSYPGGLFRDDAARRLETRFIDNACQKMSADVVADRIEEQGGVPNEPVK